MICDLIVVEGDRVRIVGRLEIEMFSLVCCDLITVSLVTDFAQNMSCGEMRMSE
jgi:hypothetical protein